MLTPSPEPDTPAGVAGPPGPLLRLVSDRRVVFLIVGGLNTAIGFGWFVLFQHLGHGLWNYMVTLVLSHIASVLCAFVLYRHLVFRVRGHVFLDLARFESVYLVAFGLNLVALPFMVEILGFKPIVAQFVFIVINAVGSWFGHSRFSFHRKPTS